MESALEGASGVETSREEAKWGGFSEVATGFRPHRAFRVSRPAQDEEAGSLAATFARNHHSLTFIPFIHHRRSGRSLAIAGTCRVKWNSLNISE